MIRIIHFSDFHLNKKNLDDWNYFIKDSLFNELQNINKEAPIDLIMLTGDLINRGGEDFKSISEAFKEFKKHIIIPITNGLSLPIERFLIIPGNHDLKKDAETEWEDIGLKTYFTTPDIINSFIKKGKAGDYRGFERMRAFKEFESNLYKDIPDCQLSCFDSNFKLTINEKKIGVSCINSSWRCFDSKKDNGLIIVGDMQVANAHNYIKDCEIKIALIHHPYDWISEVERNIIHKHLHKDYDLMFIGHVHEGDTIVQTDYASSLFVNVAPGALTDIRKDSRRYSNGFTLVDYKYEAKTVTCTYKRYNHPNKKFVLNTDLGDEGVLTFEIPQHGRLKQIKSAQEHLKVITEVRCEEMNEHLISRSVDFGPKNIKDGFVLPNLTQNFIGEKQDEVIDGNSLTLQEVTNIENDILLFGTKECGKTMLLFRLIYEYIERFEFKKAVPVYLDFLEIGNREIESCIKSYLSCGSDDLKVMLENRDIVLLVDNIQWDYKEFRHQLKKLSAFSAKYKEKTKNKKIKLIATGLSDIAGVIPSNFDLPNFDFDIYFVENLHTRQIKKLISKWVPANDNDTVDIDKRLEKIVDNFKSFALPRTAMSVSLFLWSMENKDRKPINNATLLDIFLEIVLEKIHGEEYYRERFDIKNKFMLLAHIASKMLEKKLDNYALPYSELVKIVEDYFKKEVGFEFDSQKFGFDSQKLVNYFLNRRIFIKFQNSVKFRYSCFFHFFLAKRMVYNDEFKEYILNEDRFHNYVTEIDYYTGLVRSNKKLLNEIHQRFIKEFEPYQVVLKKVNIDTHFNADKPIIKNVSIEKIKSSRPSETQLEKQTDKFLEHLPNPETILKKEQRKTLELMLVLMAKILRNSEGVEDLQLKKNTYEDIVKNTLIFILLYQFVMIVYYKKFKTLPPNIPKGYNLKLFLRNIPFHVQLGMSNHLASIKIAPVVLNKIINDNNGKSITGTDIEKFLSVFLYSDIQGQDYPKFLRKFIKAVKNNAVMDYSLYKLWHYFITRTKPGTLNEKIYLDLLSTLKLKTKSLPRRMKDAIIKALIKQRN
ncbi:MAG: metallophosphoesterase [Cytophagales bacterium]|nr:metallophosphoesterase [Cytophagales bacterium]